MVTHVGKDGTVKIGANTIAEITNYSYEETIDTVDDTSFDNTDGWKTHKTTFKEWSATITCWYDESDTNGQGALDVGSSVTVAFYPEGDDTSDEYRTGTATVTKVAVSSTLEGIVETTFDVMGNGALSVATVS